MQVDFNPVDKVYYGSDSIYGVYFKGERVWPARAVTLTGKYGDAYANPAVKITVEAGDHIRLNHPTGVDSVSWTDSFAGLFRNNAGVLTPMTEAKYLAARWSSKPGLLDNGPQINVIQNDANSSLATTFDTTGWTPGEYRILSGEFSQFSSSTVQFIITVNTPVVPRPRSIQLPDDPWAASTQTIDVVRGQTIILKYPKNPKNVNLEPKVLGWRHLNFAYVAAGQTHEAAFPRGTSDLQVDVLGETAGYAMNFSLLGSAPEANGAAFNIGHYATTTNDVIVTIRGDANQEFVYVLAYNGNHGDQYTSKGILYKLHITDALGVSPPKPAPVPLALQKAWLSWDDQLNFTQGGNLPMPDYSITARADINVIDPTQNMAGETYDDGEMFFAKDKSGAFWGNPDPKDASQGLYLQTRYGGRWISPNDAKAGDVIWICIGQDQSSFSVCGKVTLI